MQGHGNPCHISLEAEAFWRKEIPAKSTPLKIKKVAARWTRTCAMNEWEQGYDQLGYWPFSDYLFTYLNVIDSQHL